MLHKYGNHRYFSCDNGSKGSGSAWVMEEEIVNLGLKTTKQSNQCSAIGKGERSWGRVLTCGRSE